MLYPSKLRNFREWVEGLPVDVHALWKTRNSLYTREKIAAMKSGEISPFKDISALYQLKRFDRYIISNSPQEIVDAFIEEYEYYDFFTA